MRTLMGIALLLATSLASAQDAGAWGKETMKDFSACSVVGAAAKAMGTVGPDEIMQSRQCVDAKVQRAKEQFGTLPAQKKPAAANALKEYFAAWIAAMQALPGFLNEPRSAGAGGWPISKQRLDELWARFEIESSS